MKRLERLKRMDLTLDSAPRRIHYAVDVSVGNIFNQSALIYRSVVVAGDEVDDVITLGDIRRTTDWYGVEWS